MSNNDDQGSRTFGHASRDYVTHTGASKIIYCPDCGSPVVDDPEAISSHQKRIHRKFARKEESSLYPEVTKGEDGIKTSQRR
jgi:hypothetical protein